MAHWFDTLSDRAARRDDVLSRRDVIKAGGAGLVAAGVLGSPLVAEAGAGVASHLREGACACRERAWRRTVRLYLNGFRSAVLGFCTVSTWSSTKHNA